MRARVAAVAAALVLLPATPGAAALNDIEQYAQDHSGSLGLVTVAERVIPGGRQQDHQSGLILQKEGAAPHGVLTPLSTAYVNAGGATGDLGFPITEQGTDQRRGIGVGQLFEHGSIWYSRFVAWSAVVVPQVIQDGWVATGGADGPLGYPGIRVEATAGGFRQIFEGGGVWWSAATGSHAVERSYGVFDVWGLRGYEAGSLGYPTTDQVCGLRESGCSQQFQGGAVYWSPDSGPHSVQGAIRDAWALSGSQNGSLGYPTADEVCGLRDGGCAQQFQGGPVYWLPASGAHRVFGAINDAWARSGGTSSALGYPVSGENCGLRGGGCYQLFQGGSVYWSPATGANPVYGAIRDAWARTGLENGGLGYPTTGEICGLRGGGCYQLFQSGSVYWSPATGANPVYGAIRDAWARTGLENGGLGYPTSDETCGLRGGGCRQLFQGGSIYWSPAIGANPVYGAIRDAWARAGSENGLGYPLTGENCGLRGGGCYQLFQGGSIYWSPASGAHFVLGAIRDAWVRTGLEWGRLGYPTSDESFSGGAYRQTFQGGTITFTGAGVQVTYR